MVQNSRAYVKKLVFASSSLQATLLSAAKPESNGEVFNVTSGGKITINELAEAVLEKVAAERNIHYCPQRKRDILHSQANIERIGRLGYSPKSLIQRGMENTVLAMIQ